MQHIVQLNIASLPEADDQLPSEFRLLKFGSNPYWKMGGKEGELTFDEESARTVMARFAARGLDRIAIDLDHKIVQGGDSDTAGKAYGWFVPAIRPDGLYATDVKWTPEGEALLRGKSYRFFSPTVDTDKNGRVIDLYPIALTNMPALKNIAPLVAAHAKEIPMNNIFTALGCAEDADETVALSAVEQLKEVHAQVLALSGKSNVAEALGALTAMKAQAEQVVALSAEIEQLKAEKSQAEINSLIDAAVKDGRLAPAKRADVVALSSKFGTDGVKAFLSMLPKAQAPAQMPKEEPKAAEVVTLGADAKACAKEFGMALDAKTAVPSLPVAGARNAQGDVAHLFGVKADALTNTAAPSIPVGRNE